MTQQKLDNVTFFTTKFSPPSRFVRMVIRHLKIDCDIKEVDFAGGEHKSPDFIAVNPAGKLPGLKDGNLCLGESRAIACYLCNKYGPDNNLYPKTPEARARVDQVLYADMDFVNAMYGYAMPFQVFFLGEKPDLSDDSKVLKAFELYEEFLSHQQFLAADHVTIADLCAINSVAILDLCKFTNFSNFPRLKKWIEAMKKLPYYEECTGGPSKEITTLYQAKLNA